MIKTKKSLYEVLEVKSNANTNEIEHAYKKLSDNLASKEKIIGFEEAQIQKKAIDMAYDILSKPTSRDSYDAKLFSTHASPNKEQMVEVNVAIKESSKSPLRPVLAVIAGVMVIWLSIQLIYMFIVYRANNGQIKTPADVVNQAEEKLKIQEYYQEHGVRPGSGIEANLLLAEERKKENEARKKEQEKREQERKYQEWLDEGKRTSEEIDRQRMEAERIAQRELERERQEQEQQVQQKRIEEQNEVNRINSERRKLGLPPVASSSDDGD